MIGLSPSMEFWEPDSLSAFSPASVLLRPNWQPGCYNAVLKIQSNCVFALCHGFILRNERTTHRVFLDHPSFLPGF